MGIQRYTQILNHKYMNWTLIIIASIVVYVLPAIACIAAYIGARAMLLTIEMNEKEDNLYRMRDCFVPLKNIKLISELIWAFSHDVKSNVWTSKKTDFRS